MARELSKVVALPWKNDRSLDLETPVLTIFHNITSVKHTAIHRDVDTWRLRLQRTDRAPDVKNSICDSKSSWYHRSGQDDNFFRIAICKSRRDCTARTRHGVRTMRYQDARSTMVSNSIRHQTSVFVGHVETVFSHQRFDLKIERHIRVSKHRFDLGITNLEIARRVVVDFVDRATA